jgi:hypothetical protein
MTNDAWVVVEEVSGELQAELMRGLLESQEIPVRLSQEGAARAFGFTVGPMAIVEIMVPESKFQEAKTVLARYAAGDFEQLGDEIDFEE